MRDASARDGGVELTGSLDYLSYMDGRQQTSGQVIPLATAVADSKYCFLSQSGPHPERNGLTLLCAGRERCLPGYHVSRAEFPCLIIEFVVEGRGQLRVDGKLCELFPGAIFAYGSDAAHDIWADPTDPMTKYFAAYRIESQASDPQLSVMPGEIRWTRDLSTVQGLYEDLIREGQRCGKLHEDITSRYLELILLKVAESIPASRKQSKGGGRQTYEQAIGCIEQNFAEITSLDELSTHLGVGANYICRLFSRFGEESPIQCLTRHKMNRAAELLRSQPTAINGIAKRVGYEDPYYFSRVFSKRFGCSPKKFREQVS